MRLAQVVFCEIDRVFRMFLRYPVGSFATMLVLALIFVGFFETSLSIVRDPQAAAVADAALVVQKYMIWTTLTLGFASISGSIQSETQSGMMEVVWMGHFSPTVILTLRSLIATILVVSISLLVGLLVALFYGILEIFSAVLLLAVVNAAIAAVGVGLIFGAAVIVFKDIGALLNVAQFILLPVFLGVRGAEAGPLTLLPGFNSVVLLSCTDCSVGVNILGLLMPTVGWFILGVVILRQAVAISRRRGLVYEY